jgi:hypothetical protein
MPQELCPFADRARRIQQRSTIAQQLLACRRQDEPAADAIEQLHVELALQVTDLTR